MQIRNITKRALAIICIFSIFIVTVQNDGRLISFFSFRGFVIVSHNYTPCIFAGASGTFSISLKAPTHHTGSTPDHKASTISSQELETNSKCRCNDQEDRSIHPIPFLIGKRNASHDQSKS
jgi:hypothetical protein